MTLLTATHLEHLMAEFGRSMRRLLRALCRDLERNYAEPVEQLALPIDWFRLIERELEPAAYHHWRVVGWIEALNDLLYFVDLSVQVRKERQRGDLARQLLAEFKEVFYEHGYADEVFPTGQPEPQRLLSRIEALCRRLAREVTQESLGFAPRKACAWAAKQRTGVWLIPCDLSADFERVQEAGSFAVGLTGEWYEAPGSVRAALARAGRQGSYRVTGDGIDLVLDETRVPLVEYKPAERWHWQRQEPVILRETASGPLLLGSTLLYGKDKTPIAVRPTAPDVAIRMKRALSVIAAAWPEGDRLLALFTSRISPLKAKGVVSFSYRHRPGLSAINCFDRDLLDLIDDLIHENSHHHLNLLLRKELLYRHDRNQEVFYSPWRRSLRPVRGILHATFTFTMGALLFERLVRWGSGRAGAGRWRKAGLTARDLQRARYRCLEEIDSVQYSLQDLDLAGSRLKWLTRAGQRLVKQLADALAGIEGPMTAQEPLVSRSAFGPALRRHRAELTRAGETYRLG
ncbi:MAG: hypothetical protein UZ03_NOB001000387 [Nitrospira sp. OLB3]|nr:MAG: hypothetical protein UZ03_NOB001000387 [Nitrospira sp. OLB3]